MHCRRLDIPTSQGYRLAPELSQKFVNYEVSYAWCSAVSAACMADPLTGHVDLYYWLIRPGCVSIPLFLKKPAAPTSLSGKASVFPAAG